MNDQMLMKEKEYLSLIDNDQHLKNICTVKSEYSLQN